MTCERARAGSESSGGCRRTCVRHGHVHGLCETGEIRGDELSVRCRQQLYLVAGTCCQRQRYAQQLLTAVGRGDGYEYLLYWDGGC